MIQTYLRYRSSDSITLFDHGCGFDKDLKNTYLDNLTTDNTVYLSYIVNDRIKNNYPHLNLKFDLSFARHLLDCLTNIKNLSNTTKQFDNFMCSFNGSCHVSSQLLVSALRKFNFFNLNYCTKNFETSADTIDNHIYYYFTEHGQEHKEQLFRKFVLSDDSDFYKTIYSIEYNRFNHIHNFNVLQKFITSSFVQLVSETMATTYYPFVTEKFLYPTLLKTLWVAYAQPNWHSYLETYYGFRTYNKIFDYTFDSIENPVIRLVELLTMLSKFEKLSKLDLHDLYTLEYDTIEYNYDWYCSKKYLEKLRSYE